MLKTRSVTKFQVTRLITLAIALMLLISACAPQSQNAVHSVAADTAGQDTPVKNNPTNLGQANVKYSLKTAIADGKMVFIGVGGDIDGKVNPNLKAAKGDVIEILLVNGDGAPHDLVVPDLQVGTEMISGQGAQATLKFQVNEEGRFAYICSVPGHRQAGMEGTLLVGEGQEIDEVTTSVARAADDLPGPLNRTTPVTLRVDLETIEVEARLADGSSYKFWTFNGQVPGPFIRVRVGDTVEVFLKNAADSKAAHSVDFHAVTGPGGGAVATQTEPGGETSFTFKALNPGLYVYHCATPMVAHHISNGMYGLILVEPEEGLAPVDREFYVMQGEIYTNEKLGTKGEHTFSVDKLLDEQPEYFILNGSVGALTSEYPLKANVGETVRIYFGVGGPNFISSFHVIGEIFDRVYDQGALTSAPLTDVQTTLVPAGGATMVEFTLEVPGRYILVDHSLSRLERGLVGFLQVEGPEDKEVYDGAMSGAAGH
jgi:nitrite reductase (NO-forming)